MDHPLLLSLLLILWIGLVRLLRGKVANTTTRSRAPLVRSLIPWVGSGVGFGLNCPKFFRRCIKDYGPNFQATVAGKSFIFLSSLPALETFYRNRSRGLVAFRIGSNFLGGWEPSDGEHVIRHILIPIVAKGNLLPSLCRLMPDFNRRVLDHLKAVHARQAISGQPISLKHFTSFSLFCTVTGAIFGDTFPLHSFEYLSTIDDNSYMVFSSYAFFRFRLRPTQTKMRRALLDYMKPWEATNGEQDIEGVSEHGNEIIRALIQHEPSEEARASLLISFLWGVFTNTSRITFWLFAHLLHDKDAYARLRSDVDKAVEEEFPDIPSLIGAHPSVANGPRFRLLDSAIRETFRIHNLPTSYRHVSSTVDFPSVDGGTFSVKSGDVVVANTSGVHWDETIYPQPTEFHIDRFIDPNTSRFIFMFGKGAQMCTGRYLAKYVMKMFAIICIRYLDIEPHEGENFKLPPQSPLSVGMMLPTREVLVTLKKRRSFDSV